jgi:two-component system, sensor histidine kinase and response regulator
MNNSILVIDDEPNNFEVIETLLSIDNYDVYYANNGEEALASLDTFNPDVILLDLMMPVMDGLEVCNRLKLMRKWKSIPIIMVTASAGKKVLANCLAAGADDFINKPVNGIELRARVKSMLRIKKQFDRIEALTKLQQKNITLLENDLGELGCDLAVGFANELNTPLKRIFEQLKDVDRNIDKLDRAGILNLVNSAHYSALELEQLTHKFWIYLELALEKKTIR